MDVAASALYLIAALESSSVPDFERLYDLVDGLADLVEFARARGADVVTLNTQAHNMPAQRLYEWFGFRRTGEQQTVLKYNLV